MIEIPFITEAFGYILNLCYKLVPNYAIALLFFALIQQLMNFLYIFYKEMTLRV